MLTTRDRLLQSAEGTEHPTSAPHPSTQSQVNPASWSCQHPSSLLGQSFCLKGHPNHLHQGQQQPHIYASTKCLELLFFSCFLPISLQSEPNVPKPHMYCEMAVSRATNTLLRYSL